MDVLRSLVRARAVAVACAVAFVGAAVVLAAAVASNEAAVERHRLVAARGELAGALDELGLATWYLSDSVRPVDDTAGEIREDLVEKLDDLDGVMGAAAVPASLRSRIGQAALAAERAGRAQAPSATEVRPIGADLLRCGSDVLALEPSIDGRVAMARLVAVDMVAATVDRTWGVTAAQAGGTERRTRAAIEELDAATRDRLEGRGVLDDLDVVDAVGPDAVERRSDLVTDLDNGSAADRAEPALPTSLVWGCVLAMVLGGLVGAPAITAVWRRHRERSAKLSDQAQRDALTGAWNRAALDDLVHGVASRADVGFGLIYLDLDGFKAVNDGVGHHAGDEVLRTSTSRLIGLLRGADRVVRIGGDEFVAVLAQAESIDEVAAVGQRIVDALGHPIDVDGEAVHVGVSCGAVHHVGPVASVEDLIRAADAALYAAKRAGKGRVVSAPTGEAPSSHDDARDFAATTVDS